MEPTDPAYVRSIERAMEAQLRDVLHQRLERKGGVEALVSILGNVDRGTERQVLDDFDVRNPALAEEVRKRMFLFEDIVKIQPRDMQKVVQGIDLNDLALALRGAAEGELMMAFKNNMSERQRLNLEDIMSGLGPQPLSKIEDSQTRIVDRIRQMAENQEIVLARGNEELY
jgi:flagellar motor switch protein FliG